MASHALIAAACRYRDKFHNPPAFQRILEQVAGVTALHSVPPEKEAAVIAALETAIAAETPHAKRRASAVDTKSVWAGFNAGRAR